MTVIVLAAPLPDRFNVVIASALTRVDAPVLEAVTVVAAPTVNAKVLVDVAVTVVAEFAVNPDAPVPVKVKVGVVPVTVVAPATAVLTVTAADAAVATLSAVTFDAPLTVSPVAALVTANAPFPPACVLDTLRVVPTPTTPEASNAAPVKIPLVVTLMVSIPTTTLAGPTAAVAAILSTSLPAPPSNKSVDP